MGPHSAGTFLASMVTVDPLMRTRAVPPRTSGPGFWVLRLHVAEPGPRVVAVAVALRSSVESHPTHDKEATPTTRAMESGFFIRLVSRKTRGDSKWSQRVRDREVTGIGRW